MSRIHPPPPQFDDFKANNTVSIFQPIKSVVNQSPHNHPDNKEQ